MTEVRIGAGVLVAESLLPVRADRRTVAVLVQEPVLDLAESIADRLRAADLDVGLRVLPDGESAKTLQVAAETYQWLNELGLTRYDTVVGVGGGAATDLAGFVGATYLRGVETVYCPTTLLGALDASIGGKTGVNVDGKNLVGVFSPPARVIIDLDLLGRLPAELLRAGFAEALKAGLVGDVALVELFEAHGAAAPLEEVVRKAVAVKQSVVSEDFREADTRMILNYGHTIGHALEIADGLAHGDAVAVGMVAAGAIAESELGFGGADRQKAAIAQLDLPVASASTSTAQSITELIALDKKRDSTGLRMVLLEEIGRPVVVHVAEEAVAAGLGAIGVH